MKKSDLFLDDTDAYKKYPNFNHIYNRLDILKEQDVNSDPIGIMPTEYPIIIKPIIDLMCECSTENNIRMSSEKEYLCYLNNKPCKGSFWYNEIKGNHYISNLLLKNGNIIFSNTFIAHKNEENIPSFYKNVYDFILSDYLIESISILLANYTGPVCINFIDDTIIDCRLAWWKENYIFKKYSDFVSCVPILLEHNKPFKKINDDIIYVPFRVNVEDQHKNDYISLLKKFTVDYTIYFNKTFNIQNNSLVQICMIITNSKNLNDVLSIRGKVGMI